MGKKVNKAKENNKGRLVLAVVIFAIAAAAMFYAVRPTSDTAANTAQGKTGTGTVGDLVINKNEITEKAKFFPVKADGTQMEIVAVRAEDGTVRTAFNTCQVCYDSGRGYYVQKGNTLVCQNCGNVFSINDIEKQKNGCNPVPILKENKTEDNDKIVISKDFIAANKELFANWKRQ